MSHPCAQISPTHALENRLSHLFALASRKVSSGRLHEALDIEFRLLLDPLVQECADLGVFLKGLVDLFLRGACRQLLDDQRIELGVLRLFEPVMLEQALELRVQLLVVFYSLDVMTQGDPLDVQNRDPNSQRAVGQNEFLYVFGRADKRRTCCRILLRSLDEMI